MKETYTDRYSTIIKNYKEIRDAYKMHIHRKTQLDRKAISLGHNLETLVLREPTDVPMTPYLKQALLSTSEIQDSETKAERLKIDSKPTNAEAQIIEDTLAIIKDLFGTTVVDNELQRNPDLDYDRSKSIEDPHHYLIDVLRNWRKMGREVTQGSSTRRMEALDKYKKELKEIDYIKLIQTDSVFRAALGFVLDGLPSVVSTKDMVVTAQPFENKHTNVGYPFFRNDKAIDKETGKSYAIIARETAESTRIEDAIEMPAAIIGRDQRKGWTIENGQLVFLDSKARPVFAVSRIPNLHFSMLQAPETEAYKNSSYAFWGFKGSNVAAPLRKVHQEQLLKYYPYYTEENTDIDSYDTSVSKEDQFLRGAIAMYKAKDAHGKKIAKLRAVMAASMTYIDPRTGTIDRLVGRQASGFADTNLGDGIIMFVKAVYAHAKLDKDWIKTATSMINRGMSPLEVMGDDLRAIHRKDIDMKKFARILSDMNFVINISKGEYGTFFTQERTILLKDKRVTLVPFPRPISKTYWVERPKGLGPFGWTIATYMKLQGLVEWPELLHAVIRQIAKHDKYKLGTQIDGKPITFAKFMAEYKKEDALAVAEGKVSTSDKLYDGDPNKVGTIFEADGSFKKNFLKQFFDATKVALSGDVTHVKTKRK